MKKVIFLFVLILIIQSNMQAQGEGNTWYFGTGNGVNFNQTCDIADLSSSMDAVEGSVSLSDENGNLLFYTNGGRRYNSAIEGKIWNRDHEVMYDMGTNEGGGTSSRQSCIAVPKVGTTGGYYLFTMDESEPVFQSPDDYRGFSYFEIDMNLNGGLGEVVDYQESLNIGNIPGAFSPEAISAVRIPDGSGYWVVIQDFQADAPDEFLKYYRADANGVNLDHTQDPPITPGAFGSNGTPTKFSPNGEYVAFSNIAYRFDATTGLYTDLLVNVLSVVPFTTVYGVSFSPNSRYYFVSGGDQVWRFDLEAADVPASGMMVAQVPQAVEMSGLQVAPDGNIYLMHYNGDMLDQNIFSAILCPNSETPCFKENVYSFPGTFGQSRLPNFLDHYFESDLLERELEICLDASTTVICNGEEATLSASHFLADSYEWSNGETGANITVTEPGIYSVTISDGCCNMGTDEIEILSETGGILNLEIEGENVLCDGQSSTLTANSNLAISYEWSTGSTDTSIDVSTPGTYAVTVTDACNTTITEEIEVVEPASIDINIQGDTEICEGDTNTLTANSEFATTYEWSTGSTDSSIEISSAGIYAVTVTDACSNLIIDEIEVSETESGSIDVNLEGDINCGGQVMASVETSSPNIQWSTGETGTEITIEDAGNYSIQVESTCGTLSENFTIASSEKIYEMPNAFTPNQDGANDIFRPVWGCSDISNFDFKIFNRWGQMVYQSTDPMGGWDGVLNGKPATSDVFVYMLSFNVTENNRIETAGDVTLIR